MFDDFLNQIYEFGLVPVIAIQDVSDAVPLARALFEGGVLTAEITFRTPAGEKAIEEISRKVPEMLVGAGTVTNVSRAERAVDAGARYIVTPGFNPEVVSWCVDHEIPVLPGTATPSEIESAMNLGLTAVKFFPAEVNGGVRALKALEGPYAQMRFVPTGGIGPSNMLDYLSRSNVLAVGGSWMVPSSMILQRNFKEVTELCELSVMKMHSFELAHVGINCNGDAEALEVADTLGEMFGVPVSDKGGGYFAGDIADVVKGNLLGSKGHIGIDCTNVDRAKAWFERRGYSFVEKGSDRDERGYTTVFFEHEVGGFAIHLRRK